MLIEWVRQLGGRLVSPLPPPPQGEGGGISSALLALLVMIALLVWLALLAFLVDMLLGNSFENMLSILMPLTRLLRSVHHECCLHKQPRSRRRLQERDLADIAATVR